MSDILDRAPKVSAPFAEAGPRPKPGILDIAPYVGGKARANGFAHPLKLSSNENILGCSPRARAGYTEAADGLQLYPDGRSDGLRAAVASHFDLEPERLIFGCGSDEVFTLLAQVYCEPGDNVVQGQYGFQAYRIAGRAAQAEVRFAPEPRFKLDVDEVLRKVDARTRIVFVANPANPTGTWNTRAEIARLHRSLPSHVVLCLDGAYAEFVEDPDWCDGLDMARGAQNIIATRTFSKAYGLAGLRVGWGYAPVAMIDAMDRIRAPFNVNVPAQAAALAALDDEAFLERSRALVREERPRLASALDVLGLVTEPSQANFVFARFPSEPGRNAAEAEAALADEGVLVRGLKTYGIGDGMRITVGLPEHNAQVIDILTAFLASC
ncbi:histidinol-phosphate transaminase [Caulobacter sp. S45]|uniref:histidinol-phosphate transaminase n=1 Tax=Caulobacter sp. S45 TaxID=1641861 RepID=UPI001575254D|nr:histidinol-phosphate transaminase [Caulobacter sp. S45]